MANELPDWLKDLAPMAYAGGGVALKHLWDFWSKRRTDRDVLEAKRVTDQDAKDAKDVSDWNAFLITRLEQVEKAVHECYEKHELETKERQESFLGVTRALAIAETRLDVLSGNQGKLIETAMNNQWISTGVVESLKTDPVKPPNSPTS